MFSRIFKEAAGRVAKELLEAATIAAAPFIIKTVQDHGPAVAKGVKDTVSDKGPKVVEAAKKGAQDVKKRAQDIKKKFGPGK